MMPVNPTDKLWTTWLPEVAKRQDPAEVDEVVEAISKTDCGAAGFLPAKK